MDAQPPTFTKLTNFEVLDFADRLEAAGLDGLDVRTAARLRLRVIRARRRQRWIEEWTD